MESASEHALIDLMSVHNNEISVILEKYELSQFIDTIIQILKNKHNQISEITVISCGLLTRVNHNTEAIKKHDQKLKTEVLLTDLIFKIYLDFLNHNSSDPKKTVEEIIKGSSIICDLFGYKFNIFKKLIDFYKFNLIINPDKGINSSSLPIEERKKCKLIWNGKGRLEELIHQLQKRKLIKTKTAFFSLFHEDYSENIKVKWDYERKAHLAHLLYQLYTQDLIRLLSCKGYFVFAEKRFIGFDKQILKKDSLKKLSSSINTEPLKHQQVISDVSEIIKCITH